MALRSLVPSNYFLAAWTQAAVGMLIVQQALKHLLTWPLFCSVTTLDSPRPGRGPRNTRERGGADFRMFYGSG